MIGPVLLGLVLLCASPAGLFVLILSGDSCCGEDTTGTMAIVLGMLLVVIAAVSGLLALPFRRRAGLRTAWLLIGLPVAVVHVVVFLVIAP